MEGDSELSTVSIFDAFYYTLHLVFSLIPFHIAIGLLWFVGVKVMEKVDFWDPMGDPLFYVASLIFFVTGLLVTALYLAVIYKLLVDIISRSDFHFSKRDSF